ncbi:MAG: hypothetical protein M3Z25_02830 [Actinomycetota bacterium]|nr:hypothetical protein [Actinomycetota bacterium]
MGLPDDQLIALGRQAGASEQFAGCGHDQRYAPWVAAHAGERNLMNPARMLLVTVVAAVGVLTAVTPAWAHTALQSSPRPRARPGQCAERGAADVRRSGHPARSSMTGWTATGWVACVARLLLGGVARC